MKKLFQLVLMLCSIFIMTASAFAAESLIDSANLLSTQDKVTVRNALRQVENDYGVRAAVITVRDSKITDLGKYANTVLDINYTNGRNGNMLLMVNMATRKVYISTDKNMSQKISPEYGVKQLLNNVGIGLKNGKYKDAFITYAKSTGDQLAYYKANGKARPAPKTATTTTTTAQKPQKQEKGSNLPMAAGGGVLAGILAAMGYGSSLKSSMSNISSATRADQYMKPGSFKLSEKDDTFMYFTYTRVKKAKPQENHVNDDDDASDDDHDGAGGDF